MSESTSGTGGTAPRSDRIRPRHGAVRVVRGVPRGDRRTSTSLLVLGAEGKWLHRHRGAVSGSLLDLGCGNAPYEPWYSELTQWSCRVDIAPLPHLSAASTAEDLPFANESFDTILATSVIEHVDDPDRSLAEMYRVLRPGGHALISVPFMYPTHEAPYDFRRFTTFGLQKALRGAGFEVADLSPMGGPITFVIHLGVMASTAVVSGAGRLSRSRSVQRRLRALVTLPQEALRPAVSTRLGRGARRISLGYMAVARRPASTATSAARPGAGVAGIRSEDRSPSLEA